MNKNFINLALVLSVLAITTAISYTVVAWIEPTGVAPADNAYAPINTGAVAQTKAGDLTIGAGKKITTPQICVGADCWTSLPKGSCGTDEFVYGVSATGAILCRNKGASGSSFNPADYPCSTGALPNSGAVKNKKIFVTSATYNATTFVTQWYNAAARTPTYSSETLADARCNAVAGTAGYQGSFKAMVFMGNRDINQVIPGGSVFWTCSISGGWKQVAVGSSDFFTATGGNYLSSPIYNEFGDLSGSQVWTGFEVDGAGSYRLLSRENGLTCATWGRDSIGWWGSCINGAQSTPGCSGYTCYTQAAAWWGSASTAGAGWAHSGTFCENNPANPPYSVHVWNNCAAPWRALYCIEQ